jgi:hypothetical protein
MGIEIVEIGLDENLKEEIERASLMSDDIKIKLKGQLDGLKVHKVSKKVKDQRKWEGKLDIVFGILKEAYDEDPKTYIPKTTIMEAISCSEMELSPTIQKFKRYLRTTKEDKWSLSKKKIKGVASYALVPFG